MKTRFKTIKTYFALPCGVSITIDPVRRVGNWSCRYIGPEDIDSKQLDLLLKDYICLALEGVDLETDDTCRQAIIEFFRGKQKISMTAILDGNDYLIPGIERALAENPKFQDQVEKIIQPGKLYDLTITIQERKSS